MSFTVIAELPLGVYRAHVGDRHPDLVPSPARLHAALWCAAAQGPRAVVEDGVLAPCPADRESLDWLENHPPDGITVPRHHAAPSAPAPIAYRKEGMIVKEGGSWKDKVAGRRLGGAVAVDGPIAWTWTDAPPDSVRASIAALCPDVPYLGMAETPVRLRVLDAAERGNEGAQEPAQTGTDSPPRPTHWLDQAAELFGGSGLVVDVAGRGRGDALLAAHRTFSASPRRAEDRHSGTEGTRRPPLVTTGLSAACYTPSREADTPPLPWVSVLLAPLSRPVPEHDRVAWCVAAHRALISLVGDGAPASLTGVYPDGTSRPANRLAIQILDRTAGPADAAGRPAAATLAVFVPAGLSETDFTVVGAALTRLRGIRGPGGREIRVTGRRDTVPADTFWPPVPPGHRRVWQTVPAFVPDSRPPRRGPWSLADAVALSVGLVWRDLLGESGRGDAFYRRLAAVATSRGVRAERVVRISDRDPARFVHRVNAGHVITPLRARLTLGTLAPQRAVAAIGQSRHLGGGLLVPVDEPVDLAAAPGTEAGAS